MERNVFKIATGLVVASILVAVFAWKNGAKPGSKIMKEHTVAIDAKSGLDYIDPTIGNLPQVLAPTYPVANIPNQMIRVFPTRQNYADKKIANFPLTIVSYRTAKVFAVKPWVDKVDQNAWQTQLSSSHDHEEYHPWYFSTNVKSDSIKVEFSPGKKCGFYRFTFPDNAAKQLLFDVYNHKGASQWSFDGNEMTGMETFKGI